MNRKRKFFSYFAWPLTGAILVFFLALGFRLYRLDTRSAWQDECLQYSYSHHGLFYPQLVNESAVQGQPPLDASLQSIGLVNWGSGETGLRIHSVIMGALAVFFFYLLMCRLVVFRLPAVLGSLFLAVHPWLIRYSQEGRPISAAVALGIIYLLLLFQVLRLRAEPVRGNHPRGFFLGGHRLFIFFVMFQVWFILSAGFQPLVFIITSCLALVPFLFFKPYRLKILQVYLSVPVSFFLSYPILKTGIDINASIYLQEGSLFGKGLDILKNIFSVSFDTYLSYFQPLAGNFAVLIAVLLIPGVAGFVSALRKRKNEMAVAGFFYFFIFLLVYPLMFESVFKSMVKFHVKTRYFLSFTPILAAVLVFGFYYGYTFLEPLLKKKLKRPVVPLYGCFILLFLISFSLNSGKLQAVYKNKNRDWKNIYRLFSLEGTAKDSVYPINIILPGKWAPSVLPADSFYYPEMGVKGTRVRLKDSNALVADFPAIVKKWRRGESRNIFLVFVYGGEKLKPDFFDGLPGIRYYNYNRVPVIHVLAGGNVPQSIRAVFQRLTVKLPGEIANYHPFEILFYIDVALHRYEDASKHVAHLEKLDKKRQLTHKIKAFKTLLANRTTGGK